MPRSVISAQNVSKMCHVCGLENDSGLHARFFETDTGELVGVFTPREEHQGYPGRMHGGVAFALLDETIGRAVNITDPGVWGVTVELTIRYRKPVPIDGPVKAVARITKDSGRLFEGSGEIVLEDGTVAVEASGKYLRMNIDKIVDAGEDFSDQWIPDTRELPDEI